MYVFMYVYVCVYVCMSIYVCVCPVYVCVFYAYAYVCPCLDICMHELKYAYVRVPHTLCVCVCVHVCMHKKMYECALLCMHPHPRCSCIPGPRYSRLRMTEARSSNWFILDTSVPIISRSFPLVSCLKSCENPSKSCLRLA